MARLSVGEVSTRELAATLGHTDGRMIEQTYGHLLGKTKTDSAEQVASAIGL